MHVEDLSTREHVYRIVRQMTSDPDFHDDLMQEALVHLWLREARFPGQKRSWYLQSCKFHLQHYLEMGRSVDSVKRRGGQIPLLQDEDGETPLLEHRVENNEQCIFSQISARELLTMLSKWLTPREKAILDCLAEGFSAREIARKLKITHPTAIKSRRKIARLVIDLGFASSKCQDQPIPRNGSAKILRHAKSPKRNGSRRPMRFGTVEGLSE